MLQKIKWWTSKKVWKKPKTRTSHVKNCIQKRFLSKIITFECEREKARLIKQWKEHILFYPVFRKALLFFIRVLQVLSYKMIFKSLCLCMESNNSNQHNPWPSRNPTGCLQVVMHRNWTRKKIRVLSNLGEKEKPRGKCTDTPETRRWIRIGTTQDKFS